MAGIAKPLQTSVNYSAEAQRARVLWRWETPDLPTLDDVPDYDEFELIEHTRQTAQEIHDAET